MFLRKQNKFKGLGLNGIQNMTRLKIMKVLVLNKLSQGNQLDLLLKI